MISILNDSKKSNIAVLDGVRAIACFSVIAYHISLISISTRVWQPYPATSFLASSVALQGGAGVTLFFVLSGFLLFMPYARAMLFEKDWPSTKRFYLRRIFRIWPGYYITLFAIVVFLKQEYLQPDHLTYLGLFLTFFMDSTRATWQQLNGPFWTLAIEWQYYMLLPLIALVMQKVVGYGTIKQRWWRLVACLVALMAWGVGSRFAGLYYTSHPSAIPSLIPYSVFRIVRFFLFGVNGKFLEDFAVGMLVSGFYILVQQKMPENTLQWLGNKAQQYSYWLWGAGIVVLSIMMVWNCNQRFRAIPFFNALYDAFNWISELWLSVGFGLCILALLFGPPQLRRFFEWGPVRWIGLISYGLYMWHLPLLIQFNEYLKPYDHNFPGWLTYGLYWACVLLIIIPFSFAFYLCIERPGIKLSDRLLNRRAHNKDQRPITSNFSEAVPGRRGI